MDGYQMGSAEETELAEKVEANFRGETSEVGEYLAMARQAQREGLPEVAETLITIAQEEAEHAARFAELNGIISDSTEENLRKMLNGEKMAQKGKRQAAKKAKALNMDEAHDVFDESSRDEGRHAAMLQGLLDRYFSKSC